MKTLAILNSGKSTNFNTFNFDLLSFFFKNSVTGSSLTLISNSLALLGFVYKIPSSFFSILLAALAITPHCVASLAVATEVCHLFIHTFTWS